MATGADSHPRGYPVQAAKHYRFLGSLVAIVAPALTPTVALSGGAQAEDTKGYWPRPERSQRGAQGRLTSNIVEL